ncbi:hypothetical protein [Actinotalea sp. JY-7885]|uniref:hypothetical protein n=1 Tax=Actinotalea sp. JY-7885 TaxID=2758576 RepID=UPI00165E3A6E|nr:hypothetical protein [Actinotalea sp. JY-7885]
MSTPADQECFEEFGVTPEPIDEYGGRLLRFDNEVERAPRPLVRPHGPVRRLPMVVLLSIEIHPRVVVRDRVLCCGAT